MELSPVDLEKKKQKLRHFCISFTFYTQKLRPLFRLSMAQASNLHIKYFQTWNFLQWIQNVYQQWSNLENFQSEPITALFTLTRTVWTLVKFTLGVCDLQQPALVWISAKKFLPDSCRPRCLKINHLGNWESHTAETLKTNVQTFSPQVSAHAADVRLTQNKPQSFLNNSWVLSWVHFSFLVSSCVSCIYVYDSSCITSS